MLVTNNKTTSPGGKGSKPVEEQLKAIMIKLAEAEATVELFTTMMRDGVATNDTYNFVRKQSLQRKSSKAIDYKLLKTTMRQKLDDACSYTNRLR